MAKAIIIGSGIAGLATAIRLARQGIEVQVYEAADRPGGKISEKRFDGFRFDTGPSLLTMPSMVLDLLDEDLRLPIQKLEIITQYFYEDGLRLTAYSDVKKMAQEMGDKLHIPPERVTGYLQKAATVYDLTADLFIFGSFHRLRSLAKFKSIKTLFNFRKLKAFDSLHDFNEQELKDARLVQLFDRYATYNGSNPYQSPATLSVISHLEHNTGAFIPTQGMASIVGAFVQQAARLGVQFHYRKPVRKVECEEGKVKGVWLRKGFMECDIIVSNVDIHRFYSFLMPDCDRYKKITRQERSSSALVFFWGMKGTSPELDIHNIFFSARYKEEFEAIFNKKQVIDDPTVYVYISSKYHKEDAPGGCENWFVMINAPAHTGQSWKDIIEQTRERILQKLERMLGRKIKDNILKEEVLSPPEIECRTGSVNGSIYGSSSNSRYSSFNRHANFRSDIRGLYFVGGSVHPGGGIPLCLSSASIVDGLVKEQLGGKTR